MLQGLLWRCMCVCVSIRSAFPLYLKVLYDTLGSQRCSRDCSSVLVVASVKETRWVLWRVGGGITRGGAVGALTFSLRVHKLHHSRVPKGCSGGCYEPTCQVLLFSYTRAWHCVLSNQIFSNEAHDFAVVCVWHHGGMWCSCCGRMRLASRRHVVLVHWCLVFGVCIDWTEVPVAYGYQYRHNGYIGTCGLQGTSCIPLIKMPPKPAEKKVQEVDFYSRFP